MKRLLLILLFLPILSIGQTTFILNSYQVQAAGGGGGYDADAQTYFTALTVAGTTPSSPQMTSINTFVVNAKANGWWAQKKAMYFPVWSSAAANAINMRNPGTYNLTFNGSPTHTSSGIGWPGTSGTYANTSLPHNTMSQNSVSASYYSQTQTTNPTKAELGVFASGSALMIQLINASSTNRSFYMNSATAVNVSIVAGASTVGLYAITRTGSTSSECYINGSLAATSSVASTAPSSSVVYLGAYNNGGVAASYSTKTMSYSDIGDGMTSSQEASHYTDVQALHTAFSIAK